MKLRILDNSVRLRLGRSELRRLLQEGVVEGRVVFGPVATFSYALRLAAQAEPLRATLGDARIDVVVNKENAAEWAASDAVGIEVDQPTPAGGLRLLVEKDFPCQHIEMTELPEKFTPATMSVLAEPRTGS